MVEFEVARTARLSDAQMKAKQLFREIVTCDLLRPGATEKDVSDAIFSLAKELFGITTYWHKRIVRAGINTLEPYDKKSSEPDNR